ncbi:trehalase family glycosidase [Halobacterium yunchengense]|uniref:trehalase family glycosidase n=1 Tax=Halobacterium yunchengense TaxID=3108497 RepID=UPI00300B44E0
MSTRAFDYRRYPQVAGELFRSVQERGLFEDCKHFVDAEPRVPAARLRERYLAARDDPGFDLAAFVERNFRLPDPVAADPDPTRTTMESHVESLWGPLTRSFDVDPDATSTLVSLPNPHVVPGGRFREMYYWDSYFAAEGLATIGRVDAVAGMVENVASLVDRFGFVPLGNRVYYDSRSQLPLFYRMLRILERERGFDAVAPFVDALETEYAFWMDGRERVGRPDGPDSHRRTVSLPDGPVANRYWDDRTRPRPESYRQDRELAAAVPPDDRPQLFRDVRAACESGWDFSSRWFADDDDRATIRTTDIVPVDLNAVLYGVESALTEWLSRLDRPEAAGRYADAADRRRRVVERYCWDDDREFYVDYCWADGERVARPTLAGVVPLFTGAADPERADAVARRLREDFLYRGGLVTTLSTTGEQWDAPNGWAPLHWMAAVGLRRYGHDDLAAEVTDRWLALNRSAFAERGRMAEKYDVQSTAVAADDGEYRLQYGFGWTNGVVTALGNGRGADAAETAPGFGP